MSTYSDHEQRLLDQQSGAELDRQALRDYSELEAMPIWTYYMGLRSFSAEKILALVHEQRTEIARLRALLDEKRRGDDLDNPCE